MCACGPQPPPRIPTEAREPQRAKCKQKSLIKPEFSISKIAQRLHLKITEVLLYSFVQPSHDPN